MPPYFTPASLKRLHGNYFESKQKFGIGLRRKRVIKHYDLLYSMIRYPSVSSVSWFKPIPISLECHAPKVKKYQSILRDLSKYFTVFFDE